MSSSTTVVALILSASISARANTIVQIVTETPSGSNSNVTNGHPQTVFSVVPTFNQFNPADGTLVSATLSWSASGILDLTATTFGGAVYANGIAGMSYQTTADNETWKIPVDTTTVNFSISGSESLTLADVTGTGSFDEGPFAETYQLQGGLFPDSFSTGPTSGTFTLTYDFTPVTNTATVPEPASALYLFTTIPLLALSWFARATASRRQGRR